MSRMCLMLGLGLAFAASLVLNYFSGETVSLPLWQKAAYFLSGGVGMVIVSRILGARERSMRVVVRDHTRVTDR
jgi:hypothetical protein